MQRVDRTLAMAVVACLLSACSLAPTYHMPTLPPMPASYKEAGAAWQAAQPSDAASRGVWWSVYGDETLNRLEAQLDRSNPSLAVALAHYDTARAYESQLQSGLFPHLGAMATPGRARQSDNRPTRGANQPNEYDSDTVGVQADYDLDVWGRIRNSVSEGRALAQAAQADLVSAKLSLQAQLADDYVRLRGYDIQTAILANALNAYGRALTLTEKRHAGGIASGLDVSRAQTQLHDAQAQVTEVAAQRALIEHAIANLAGESASGFSIAPAQIVPEVPVTPIGLPSVLLERRPDIAAAERRVYAANAGIGVARAALFPSLSLSANYGFQNSGMGQFFAIGNRFWAVGPMATLDIFDAGLRRAKVHQAQAAFDEAAANYRLTVLTAFRQVEDNLVLLRDLGTEAEQEDQAVVAANTSLSIATHRYREGVVNYLDVVTAQTASLAAQRNAETLRTRRLQASVDLIRALGGGWSRSGIDAVASTNAVSKTAQ